MQILKSPLSRYSFCKLPAMSKMIFFVCAIFMSATKTFPQKTPAEFGSMAFYCFQHNKMDSLFRTIPSLTDLSGFAEELGIVKGSQAYSDFQKKYPLVVKSFRDRCYQIEADSQSYHFSWSHARIDKIELSEKAMHTGNAPSKDVDFTVISIYFTSGTQKFLLKFGDLHKYMSGWKPGSDVSLTLKYD
jgi:hypothetical protein